MITGVLGLPLRKDGKMLLTRRNAPRFPNWHNKWQLPGGGMEFGETAEQTLSREFQEELGVSARILFPHPIVKTKVWYGDHIDRKTDTHLTLLCYLVSIDGKIDISGDAETNDYAWLTFAEALEADHLPLTDDFLKEAHSLIAGYDILKKIT